MRLEGYYPEKYPLDVQQQVCGPQQRKMSQLISIKLREVHRAIWSVLSPELPVHPCQAGEGHSA